MNIRKTFFILPNLFTLSSLFCGFFAIITVASGGATSIAALYQACVAIAFGVFFDLADGRVARLTKTQSSLGLQLDSLSDLVTFGVAPALLIYRWGLDRLVSHVPHVGKHLGLVVVFGFVATAALRLARFNVLAMAEAEDKKKPGKYIIGLPVPVAASVLCSIVFLNYQLHGSFVEAGQAALTIVVVALSYLMVSRVRFRSFKDLHLSRRTLTTASAVVAAFFVVVFYKRVPSGFIFVTLLGTYLALGLMEEMLFYRRRRAEEAAAKNTQPGHTPADVEADGGARSDEEVLEELGAYDEDQDHHPPTPSTSPTSPTYVIGRGPNLTHGTRRDRRRTASIGAKNGFFAPKNHFHLRKNGFFSEKTVFISEKMVFRSQKPFSSPKKSFLSPKKPFSPPI